MEWRSPELPRRKKVKAKKSRFKTMFITFFDSQNIIHKEFLLEGTTMKVSRYIEILIRLIKRLRRLISSNSSWQKKRGRAKIEHPPPNIPDLNPPDMFLFLQLKLALKGKRFDDIPNIQRKVTMLLNSIPKEDFLQSFQDMHNISQG
ncbi:mariner Mos1 transposase [Trichonephila clavipes]|nr:mariner Mos1 transposase [Trichonephila clavipes]